MGNNCCEFTESEVQNFKYMQGYGIVHARVNKKQHNMFKDRSKYIINLK